MLLVLVFRLASLTIVQGEEYRAEADVKTIRDIPIKAPRGNIYDRNGVLLAGNVPSFTVQMRKDDIDSEDLNDTVLLLAEILDRNNEKILDEFPIELNSISFDSDYSSSEYYYPEEKVEVLFVENNLVEEIFTEAEDFVSLIDLQERISFIMNKELEDFPVSYKNGEYYFTDITIDGTTPVQYIIDAVYEDSRILGKYLTNSEIRLMMFNILYENDLVEGLELVPYSFIYDNDYYAIKKDLVTRSDFIDFTTDAKSDFSYLVRQYCYGDFFRNVFTFDEENIIPGVTLYDKVKELHPDIPIVYTMDVEQDTVYFNFTNNEEKNEFFLKNGYSDEVTAYSILVEYAIGDNIDFEIITSDEVKYFAQEELLAYINPSISVSRWEYTAILKKVNWVEGNLGNVEDDNISAQNVFHDLKENAGFEVEISDYLARKVFTIKERYVKQGYLAFHPIDISYGVAEKTVALISENYDKLEGVEITVEPLRYYPYKESAAHVLGYLGRISQDYEIEKYINQGDYLRDDMIGKTGIEENFEYLLNGTKGSETLKVDVYGNRISTVETGEPVPGNNLYLTLDIELQRNAEKYLQNALEQIQVGGVYESKWGDFDFDHTYKNAVSGALVVLDVNTGEVLAMVNNPSYDPNLFSTGISQNDWQDLLNESKNPLAPKPLYNISMLTAIQPGSTFKIVTALAALEKGISPYEEVYCAGHMEIGSQTFGCWIWNMYRGLHGYENMYEAIRDSCNFYFYSIVLGENKATGEKTSVKVELEDIMAMAEQLGLNDKTGIEMSIPTEVSGRLPDPDTKISNIKYFLRLYLDDEIENFVAEGTTMNDDEKEQIVNEIVSWVRGNEPLTRTEVFDSLEDLGLDPVLRNNSGIPLGDIIKYTYLNQAVWNDGDTMNISIGQGSNAYTPIQMANYIATVANGGYRRNISVIQKGTTYNKDRVTYLPERNSERIELSDYSFLDIVTKGMVMVSEATGNTYTNFPVDVASKTGTAEKDGLNPETGEPYDDFGWYVAFAPAEEPEIAVAAVIFQGGSGRYPAPVVREIIGDYLNLKSEEELEQEALAEEAAALEEVSEDEEGTNE
jgi:penicillin-binding protein 2